MGCPLEVSKCRIHSNAGKNLYKDVLNLISSHMDTQMHNETEVGALLGHDDYVRVVLLVAEPSRIVFFL